MQNNSIYKPGIWFFTQYGVSTATLRSWANSQKVTFIRTPGGKRFYLLNDVYRLLNVQVSQHQQQRYGIVYARVSSHKQRSDLQRQIQTLQQAYPSQLQKTRPAYLIGTSPHRHGLRSCGLAARPACTNCH